ncbi:MAG TPA: hypothetical protein DCQ31_02105 [Bacteroidales bacterium]|nr:hypothetical protein [Bacteroidales bacterium]
MKKVLVIFAVIISYSLHAQTVVDSLKQEIAKAESADKIALMILLHDEYLKIDPELAASTIEEALELSKTLKDKKLETDVLINYAKLLMESSDSAALVIANQALYNAKKLNDTELQSDALFAKARIHMFIGNADSIYICLKLAERLTKQESKKAEIINFIGVSYNNNGEYNKAKQNFRKAIELNKNKNTEELAQSFTELSHVHYRLAEYDSAEVSLKKSIEIYEQLKNSVKVAESYNLLGVLYRNSGNYEQAIQYYQRALDIFEKQKNTEGQMKTLGNIGNFYFYFGDNYDKSLEFNNRALVMARERQDQETEFHLLNNIGMAYKEKKEFAKALGNFEEGLKIVEQFEYEPGIATAKNNIGTVYSEMRQYGKALKNMNEALVIYEKRGMKKETALAYAGISDVYYKQKLYSQAIEYNKKAIAIGKEINLKKEVFDFYKEVSTYYYDAGNYKLAYENFKEYSELRDTIFNEESMKQITEMEAKYETEKKQQQIELQTSKLQQQATVQKSLFVGVFFVLVMAFLAYFAYLTKKKANTKLEEVNLEITMSRDQIAHQNEQITDSIQYARRIQTALLPPVELFNETLPDHFVLNKPRNIVSGDFYWMTKKENKIFIAVADCTGHGVPGAFMSMLGIAFLNEISNKLETLNAAQILDELRNNVIASLRQTGKEKESKDGMDMALCVINIKTLEMEFAGANNPVLILRNSEVISLKPDKMPIGIYTKAKENFTNNEFQLEKHDKIYLFSDGYIDQFGEETGRKFMIKNFKEMLVDINTLPMDDQRIKLNAAIENWMGSHPQIDDILVVGLSV